MIIERVKRKIEANLCIVPQSTPIVYFGNYDTSKACTISLNPSNKEFTDRSNILLDHKNKERLCSRKRLKKQDIDELTDAEAELVLKYCTNYFNLRPYTLWFDTFNYFIEQYGNYSYYKGSCVHLDLVQWATSKKWNALSPDTRHKHLNNDLPVLKYLLNKDFETMFLNGSTVVNNIAECLSINLKSKTVLFTTVNNINRELVIYYGNYNKTNVIGWNLYLQSAAVGGNENKRVLCELIKKHIPNSMKEN